MIATVAFSLKISIPDVDPKYNVPRNNQTRVRDGTRVEAEPNPTKRKKLEKELGKKGVEAIAAIPGYFEMEYIVDVMHADATQWKAKHSSK